MGGWLVGGPYLEPDQDQSVPGIVVGWGGERRRFVIIVIIALRRRMVMM